MVSSASVSEKGTTNGTPGDSTGREYYIREWYDGPWDHVFRHPDAKVRQYICANAISAANNNKIGYGQSDRHTFWTQLEAVGYDASKITIACNTDCSASTCAIIKAAGYLTGNTTLQSVQLTTTSYMTDELTKAGFQVLTDTKYLKSEQYLEPGDVLLKTSKHACIEVGDASNNTNNILTVTDGSNVLVIGDSITAMAKSAIQSKLPQAKIDGLSSSWFSKTSSGLASGLTRLQQNITNQTIIVFAMGTNGGVTQSDIDQLLSLVSQYNFVQQIVLMTTYYGTTKYGASTQAMMRNTNDLVKSVASSHSNITYFDWYEAVSANPSTYILNDDVHPTSPAGVEKFAELIYNALGGIAGSSFTSSNGATMVSMFASRYEIGDAMVREFCYLDQYNNFERVLSGGKYRLSVINYAPLVEQIADAQGIYLTSGLDSGNSEIDTSQLDGNCKIIVDFLISMGLNGAAACGVAGNIFHESGFNPAAVGDSGTSFGICQWHASRGNDMISRVGSDWRTNLTGQCEYLWYDLNTNYASVLNYLKGVPNTEAGARSAADYFVRHFEIPAGVDAASVKRQATAAEYFNQLILHPISDTIGQNNLTSYSGKALKLQKTIQVPESVQYGLVGNFTNYTYWFPRWAYDCRTIADIWAKKGRTSNKGIATIDGHYLIAMTPKFADTGDLVVIHLKNGESFTAILGDAKGNDATSEWGHVMSRGLVDVIEWEAIGSASSAAGGTNIQLGSWSGVKVTSVDNYGSWLHS